MSDPGVTEDEGEVVEGLPVVAPRAMAELSRAQVPAKHAAALAATSFVAGAATVAVVSRRVALRPRRRRRRKAGGLGEIVASNSFLVDVHLLRRP